MEQKEVKTKKVIFIGGSIENSVILGLQEKFYNLINEGQREFVLQINSGGGECDAAWALHDIFTSQRVNFNARVYGRADSMAIILMLIGHHRQISKNSRVFLHEMGSTFPKGRRYTRTELKKQFESLDYLNDQYASYISDTLGENVSKDTILKMMREETYLTPEQALEMGFVHEILES
jgi:ATP-dependent Clp protease, protease subunit